MKEKIDIIIPWVDGSDKEWQRSKNLYKNSVGDDRQIRYRDWDNLKYLFRGIEEFLPWVNNIYFITYNQKPDWLNTSAAKLKYVVHNDFIPQKYLPTFSANPIELNFNHINDLSEYFIYANDDMFFLKPLKPSFFFKDGLPVDCCIETANQFRKGGIAHIIGNDLAVINDHFPKKETIRNNKNIWFSAKYGTELLKNIYMLPFQNFAGFSDPHLPTPYLKSTWNEVWKTEPELLDRTCEHKVRSNEDVNQWLFRYWQFVTGKITPGKPKRGKYLDIGKDDELIEDIIVNQKEPMICLNDVDPNVDFEKEKKFINNAFSKILDKKSSFEL